MSAHTLDEVLHPNSIAVAGASSSGRGISFVSPLIELGFKGKIYPVNPKYQEIMGMKAYPTVRDIPDQVDFVISSIPAGEVLKLVEDCAVKGVKAIHFFTARFSETGRKDASDLEKELLKKCREADIRIIGPNGMGVYYPAWGVSFNSSMPRQSGPVGVASQSGSAVHDIVDGLRGRGVYCSKAISYGNAIDFNECDYLEYYGQDPDTNLVLMYIEGVRDGQRFLKTMREVTLKKPVVVLKGGRGKSGTRATASHTASLAGSMVTWYTAIKQGGAINVADMDELIDVAAALYYLPPIYGLRTGVSGGSGGSSVMGADQCEESGLDVIPLPDEIRQELKARNSPIWDWVSNPADFSIGMGGEFNINEVLELMAKNPNFDLLITYMNNFPRGGFRGPWGGPPSGGAALPLEAPVQVDFLKPYRDLGKPLLIVQGDRGRNSDSSGETNRAYIETLDKMIEAGLPAYPTMRRAANAAVKLVAFYQNQRARLSTAS